MAEIAYNLERDRTTGTKRFEGFEAKVEKLKWWLHTPRWSKINKPDWGHSLEKYLNEAMTEGTLQDIEAELVIDIEKDLGLKTVAICTWETSGDSLCNIAIIISDGIETILLVDQITA